MTLFLAFIYMAMGITLVVGAKSAMEDNDETMLVRQFVVITLLWPVFLLAVYLTYPRDEL